jgi:PAP2 superfamily
LRKIVPNLHYAATVLLAVLAVPAIRHLGLTTHLNWRGIMLFYWVGLGPRSLLYAMAFCLLALPLRQSVGPLWARYTKEKLRFVFALLLLGVLNRLLAFPIAILLTANALMAVELAERSKADATSFRKKAVSVIVSAVYMLLGVTLVMIYNDIIVASRFPLSYDAILNQGDSRILWGQSVSAIAHRMFTVLPPKLLSFLDTAYFQMFLIVGATLLISAYHSRKRGLQFVGACLTAYYLTLLIFYFWPTYGPYIFCPTHAAQYPGYLTAYVFQTSGMPGLQAIAQHKTRYLASGYYIAFPSMHIGLPVIAMWFMRYWRPVFWLLAAYVCTVAFAVVILEWHYALDIPGGIAVGALALAITGRDLSLGGE